MPAALQAYYARACCAGAHGLALQSQNVAIMRLTVMNQYEVPALIADNIPEVRHELAGQDTIFRMTCNNVEWRLLQAKMPITLYSIYIRQVMQTGC